MEEIKLKVMDLILVNGMKMGVCVVVKADSSRVYYCPLTQPFWGHTVQCGGRQRSANAIPIHTNEGVQPIRAMDKPVPFGDFKYFQMDADVAPWVRRVNEDFLTPVEKQGYEFFKAHL